MLSSNFSIAVEIDTLLSQNVCVAAQLGGGAFCFPIVSSALLCSSGANNMGTNGITPATGAPGMHLGMGMAAGAAACLSAGMQQQVNFCVQSTGG